MGTVGRIKERRGEGREGEEELTELGASQKREVRQCQRQKYQITMALTSCF